jgi:DNA/RNA-binding domain of Phe-tRNA-synthetase-like protein
MSGWLDKLLLWYSPDKERLRDAQTERISQRSEAARRRADSAIAAYRQADDRSRRAGTDARAAGEAMIEELEDG